MMRVILIEQVYRAFKIMRGKRIINKTKNGLCIIYFKYKRIDFMLNKLENVSYKSFDNYTSEDDLTKVNIFLEEMGVEKAH